MNRFLIRSILGIGLSLLLVVGCSKSSTDSTEEIPKGIQAKIDGTQWKAASAVGIKTGDLVTLTGTDAQLNSLVIQISGFKGVGKYPVPNLDNQLIPNSITYQVKGGQVTYGVDEQHTGTIEVKKYENNTIEGTFSATVQSNKDPNDVKKITEGTFSVTLSGQ